MKRYLFLFLFILQLSCNTLYVFDFNFITNRISGNKYYLKSGIFVIDKTVEIPSDIVIIGNNTTFKWNNNTRFPLFKIDGKSNISIKNINFVGEPLNNSSSKEFLEKINYDYIFLLNKSTNISIERVRIKNHHSTCFKIFDSDNIKFKNCKFENLGLSGYKDVGYSCDAIYIGGDNEIRDVLIDSCEFFNIGMSFESGYYPWPNDGDGVHILTSGIAKDMVISNSNFVKCSSRGVKIQSGNNILIEQNRFENCGSAVLLPMFNKLSQITIKENQLQGVNVAFGIDHPGDLLYMDGLNILNNVIDSCEYFFRTNGNSGVKNCRIINNRVQSTKKFFIAGRFENSEFTGNRIGTFANLKNSGWNMGVLLLPECKNVKVIDNQVDKHLPNTIFIENRSNNNIEIKNNKLPK